MTEKKTKKDEKRPDPDTEREGDPSRRPDETDKQFSDRQDHQRHW